MDITSHLYLEYLPKLLDWLPVRYQSLGLAVSVLLPFLLLLAPVEMTEYVVVPGRLSAETFLARDHLQYYKLRDRIVPPLVSADSSISDIEYEEGIPDDWWRRRSSSYHCWGSNVEQFSIKLRDSQRQDMLVSVLLDL